MIKKMFSVFALLLAFMAFPSNALFAPPPPTTYCRSVMNDMVVECLPYFVDRNYSQPRDLIKSCCSVVESVVATASGCICDIHMDMNNLQLNVTKMVMKLPTVCGVSLPCNLDVSAAPSSVDGHALENLISSSSQSPSQSSSKPQPNHAPNSPAPAPLQVQVQVADDSLNAHDDDDDDPILLFPIWLFLIMIIFLWS